VDVVSSSEEDRLLVTLEKDPRPARSEKLPHGADVERRRSKSMSG